MATIPLTVYDILYNDPWAGVQFFTPIIQHSFPGPWTKIFFLDRDRDQNIFEWDRHQNLFLKGPGPKMTGPAHVYP